ncbi:Vacuolar protein sorting-associated protein 52 [Blastocladiella emersonii ATCC 22665]|nr:Vacuolar protein sorting-associated protein 52 [Blastocladiella emersonii ATCC 22665]
MSDFLRGSTAGPAGQPSSSAPPPPPPPPTSGAGAVGGMMDIFKKPTSMSMGMGMGMGKASLKLGGADLSFFTTKRNAPGDGQSAGTANLINPAASTSGGGNSAGLAHQAGNVPPPPPPPPAGAQPKSPTQSAKSSLADSSTNAARSRVLQALLGKDIIGPNGKRVGCGSDSGSDNEADADGDEDDDESAFLGHVDDIAKVPELATLESSIAACEGFLENMTTLLQGFQTDLGAVSSEIAALHARSQRLATSQRNRAQLQSRLARVLDGTVLSPSAIQLLVDGEVTEAYQDVVVELDAKMAYVKRNKAQHIRAFKDVGPELERLRNRVAEKAREFFLDKLRALRHANTNLQMHQANVLLRFKPLHEFVLTWHPEVAQEIRGHYIHVVARYHQALFERYVKTLARVVSPVADRSDVLGGAEDSASGGGASGLLAAASEGLVGSAMSFFRSSPAPSSSSAASTPPPPGGASAATLSPYSLPASKYAIGDRARLLRDVDAPVIIGHVADEHQLRYPIEAVVRSLLRMLVDAASTEYGFDSVFFVNRRARLGSPAAIAQAVFMQAFEPTLKTIAAAVGAWVTASYDALGLAVAARVHDQHVRMLEARGVTVASLLAFMSGLQAQLVDRYTLVMSAHTDSIRKRAATMTPSTASSRGSSRTNAATAARDPRPHYVARRYAELAASVLGLELPVLAPPMLAARAELETLLARAAAADFPASRDGLVFLINNYDMVATVLEESIDHLRHLREGTPGGGNSGRGTPAAAAPGSSSPPVPSSPPPPPGSPPPAASPLDAELMHWQKLLHHKTMDYVDTALAPSFGFLLTFVDETEPRSPLDSVSAQAFEDVSVRFGTVWRGALADLSTDVVRQFASYQHGAAVLHAVLAQVAVYWQRYHALLDKRFPAARGALPFRAPPVGAQNVLVEIKKYRGTF